MPDRNPVMRRTLYFFMGVITILSLACLIAILVAVSYAGSASESSKAANTAVRSLKKSSARSECRTQLINSEADVVSHEILHFQQNIDKLLLLSGDASRVDEAKALAKTMAASADHALARPEVQDAIDKQCPPPLVKTTPYTVAP